MSHESRQPAPQSSALFRQIFEMRMAFLAVLDPAGIVLEINRAPLRLGLKREQFIGLHVGKTPAFAGDPDWVRTWNTRLADAAALREPQLYEDLFTGPDGELRSADAVLTAVFDDDGNGERVDYFLLEADDTTDRVQVELALRESERRFHDLAESLPVLCWSFDASGSCDYFNHRWLDYTGAAPGAHHGWAWTEAVHPDDRPGLGEILGAALRGTGPFTTDFRLRSRDGGYRWFEARAVPVLGPEGEVTRWYGTAADVHDARELRRELDEREGQLTAALEAGKMARFSYELEQRRFTADAYLSEIIELPQEMGAEAGLDGFLAFVHPDDRAMWQRTMMRAFDPQTPEWSLEYRLQSAADEPTWIGARGRVTFNEAGRPRSITGVVFALPGRRTNAIDAARSTGVPDGLPISLSWPSRLDPRD
ncbi:MAG: PAS domain-containing protein [Solirubrobacteraceae bacterium]|nr:PAS domain-containing protein [Solirubrobacteraceae bacterium]